jgi:hypothetical protein
LSGEEKPLAWEEALSKDPEYYMETEKGQKELAEMIRMESERLLEELGRSVKRTRDIIWLSRYCEKCKFFQDRGRKTRCSKWDVRIVKPFYGRPIWTKVASRLDPAEKERVVQDIDWSSKWREISDSIVEWAVDHVNGGLPYFCYSP